MSEAGDRIASRRMELGWTLGDLADRSTVNRQTIHEIETGETAKPQRKTIAKLTAALDEGRTKKYEKWKTEEESRKLVQKSDESAPKSHVNDNTSNAPSDRSATAQVMDVAPPEVAHGTRAQVSGRISLRSALALLQSAADRFDKATTILNSLSAGLAIARGKTPKARAPRPGHREKPRTRRR